MRFLYFIGAFFLFRWLFGDSRQEAGQGSVSEPRDDYSHRDYGRNYQTFDEFNEEQDDYDMMDDF